MATSLKYSCINLLKHSTGVLLHKASACVNKFPWLQEQATAQLRKHPAIRRKLLRFGADKKVSESFNNFTNDDQCQTLDAPFALPLPSGERTIYVYVDHTVFYQFNSGVQRVTRGIAASLRSLGEKVLFVKWSADKGQCVFITMEERQHLAHWNGPSIKRTEADIYPSNDETEIAVSSHLPGENHWLIVPEVPHITRHKHPVTLDLLQWSRRAGLRSGFVFYDAIPLRREELQDMSDKHKEYMRQLLLADIVWPISQWSADDLIAFWLKHECASIKTMPAIEALQLPGESILSERIRKPRDGEKIILSVGSIEPRKNQVRLVNAFTAYRKAHPESEWRLILVGALHGSVARTILRAQRTDEAITHLGQIPDQELDMLYRSCAFTVFPSIEEGFGLPILESLWYAKPCVCANFGAMAEVAARGGCYTVDTRDQKALEEAITNLMEDETLRGTLATEAASRPITSWVDYGAMIRERIETEGHPKAGLGRIYYCLDAAPELTKETNIQRVSSQLACTLLEMGIPLIPVKWDNSRSGLGPVTEGDLAIFAKRHGPKADSWQDWTEPDAGRRQDWFFMPEVPLNRSPEEHARMLKHVQSSGLRCAAIFYDAASWKMQDIYPENFAAAHREYMLELSRYDLVLPISALSQKNLIDFLGASLPRPQGLDSRIKAAILPEEFSESSRVTVPTLHEDLAGKAVESPLKTWHDYALEVAARMAEATPASPKLTKLPLTRSEIETRAQAMIIEPLPRLSVCISTYNRADWLAKSLENFSRLYPEPLQDVEILICDNASTDHTPNVVKQYLIRKDFAYHKNLQNVGMLGNLCVTAHHARGEYVWILGDDDLLMPGSIERILEAIKRHEEVALIYLNYAFTRIEDARTIDDFGTFFSEATPIVPAEADLEGPISSICARNENFFTAIYTLVFRRDFALKTYSQDTGGRPFSTMLTCIPTTYYILHHMMDEPGVWIGEPQIVVNMNVSWLKYAPLWILERLPEVYELAEQYGASEEQVDCWRKHSLPAVVHCFEELFYSDPMGNAAYFRPERLIRRFKHLPDFVKVLPLLRETYVWARSEGNPAASRPVSEIFLENKQLYG